MARVFISLIWAPLNCSWRRSLAAVRISGTVMSSATALASGLALVSCLAARSDLPPANASFSKPQRPLGSAAVMAMPATIGLATTRVHSSGVKFALPAMSFLLHLGQLLERLDGSLMCSGPDLFHGPVNHAARAAAQSAYGNRVQPFRED